MINNVKLMSKLCNPLIMIIKSLCLQALQRSQIQALFTNKETVLTYCLSSLFVWLILPFFS